VQVSGTSYAAPEVSGVVAMMLQANPGLGWRDVQEILADSAYMPQAAAAGVVRNAGADWNGGGRHFSDDVGFGAVDAQTAVQIARAWTTTSTTADMATASATGTGGAIGAGVTESVATVAGALRVQHVQVTLNAASLPVAEARIVLVSPDGTRSVLLDRAGFAAGADQTGGRTVAGLTLDSNAFRGEAAQGAWHLEVQDAAGHDAGTLGGWSLHIDGDVGAAPLVYTPEFAQLALADASRRVVGAAGATALIAAGDMTGATALDLDGGDGTLDGVAVHVLGGLTSASFTGVQALVSVAAAQAGACTITGGEGPCTIRGGNGGDVLTAGRGASVVTTGAGGSLVDLQPHSVGADAVSLHGRDTVMAGGGTVHLDVAGPGALVYAQSATLDVADRSAGSTVVGGAGAATVYGGAGDTVFFTGQGSSFVGGSGTATVIGHGGDTIWAAAGGGQYYAGTASTVSTQSGFSLVMAGAGTLATLGGDGADLVVLGAGSDTVDGSAGSGAHTIFAGSGDDTILGGGGADIVFAGTGNATLAGGAGAANLFVFVDGAAGGHSAISDFRVGEDHLMLQGYGGGAAADAVSHAIVTGDATILSLADGTQVSLLHVAAASSQVFL
jgi:subtilisin-like proprotein convertase family protein